MRRTISIWLCLAAASVDLQALAQEKEAQNQVLLIDSGYVNGLYYQTAAMIAMLNSQPSGGLPCKEGGSCGVENVVLVNRSSHGSTENLQRLCNGQSDSALVQSNLAYMAYQGEGAFESAGACKQLRALASLYTEVLQIAVPKASGIHQLSDLAGKRIGIGAVSSGTHHAVQEVLTAAGVNLAEVKFHSQSISAATQALEAKELDAIVFFAGIPAPAFEDLQQKMPLRFLSLEGAGIEDFLKRSRSYQAAEIDAGAYAGSEEFRSVRVRALWVSTEKLDKDWAYQFTKNLWHSEDYPLWLKKMRSQGSFEIEHSLEGIAIPLHDGAKRYYNEIGKRY